MAKRQYFTDKDLSFLKENYMTLSIKEIASKLNRTESSIRGKANNLKLKRPSKIVDIVNQRFIKLLVIDFDSVKNYRAYWRCLCDCGNYTIASGHDLRNGSVTSCGCVRNRDMDLSGSIFGELNVTSLSTKTDKINTRYWNCLCSCGNTCVVRTCSLLAKHNNTRSCGCLLKRQNNKSPLWKGVGEISAGFYNVILTGAKRRNIEVMISIEELWDKFISQNKLCGLTGEELFLPKSTRNNYRTASVDRIDNNLGYTTDNTWWIHKACNEIKVDLSIEELLYWCSLVVKGDTSFNNESYTKWNTKIKIINHNHWKGYNLLSGRYWGRICRGANKRNILVNLSIREAWDIFVNQNGRCKITNLPLTMIDEYEKFHTNQTASLDRIDSSKDYTADNCQWVHKTINQIKWDYPVKDFINWCTKIHYYNIKKENL